VAELTSGTKARLDSMLPAFASSANPVDVTAQFIQESVARTGELCRVVAEDPGVDHTLIVLTNLTGPVAVEFAESLLREFPNISTPVSMVFLAAADRTVEARTLLTAAGVPVYEQITAALAAIAALSPGERFSVPSPSSAARSEHHAEGSAIDSQRVLTEAEGATVLDAARVPRPLSTLVHSELEAIARATALPGLAVLKVQSPDVLHKTEVGGVRVAVAADAVGGAYTEMLAAVRSAVPDAHIDGVLVQELVGAGLELLVGITGGRDGYGPVIVVAAGGIAAELYGDTASALAPLDVASAEMLLRSLKSWALLDGYRGRPRLDVTAACEAIAALSRVAVDFGDALIDLEVNPLIVHEHGVHAADFLARLRS
jgi:acyl-CoA synthetase (NDP forming)